MCLILLAWRQHSNYPLVLAANRDEYHRRPTAVAGPWPDCAEIVGGRDLLQGGSWLAMAPQGRFAVVTNFRETPPNLCPPRSRGRLVRDYLVGDQGPADYLARVADQGELYRGFSLLVGDHGAVGYLSNRAGGYRLLPPGVYGVSNALLDCPWYKVNEGRRRLRGLLTEAALDREAIFRMLADPDPPPPGVGRSGSDEGNGIDGPESPFFICGDVYGTRCSTLLWSDRSGGMTLVERSFAPNGVPLGEVCHQLKGS